MTLELKSRVHDDPIQAEAGNDHLLETLTRGQEFQSLSSSFQKSGLSVWRSGELTGGKEILVEMEGGIQNFGTRRHMNTTCM